MQLAGNNPEEMAWAAALVASRGADFVDVNLGCPIDYFTGKGLGTVFLKTIKPIRAATSKPERHLGVLKCTGTRHRLAHAELSEPGANPAFRELRSDGHMLILLIIVLVLLFGGGGGYYYGRGAGWGTPHFGGGLLGLVLIVVLILWLSGHMGGGMMIR